MSDEAVLGEVSQIAALDGGAAALPVSTLLDLACRKLTLLPLVMVMFFTVSGGAYGLEDLIGSSGPGMALLLILLTPLIWSLPTALMVAELSSAMPVQGGYYAWVKRGLGPFWAFQEGWWSWLNSFVDMAVYPVLFAKYLSTLLAQQFDIHLLETSALAQWGVTLVVIWTYTLLNIRGAKMVGDSCNLFGLFLLAPFGVMSVLGIWQMIHRPTAFWQPFIPPDTTVLSSFGVGLFVVMWNYQGWDNVSTVGGEIEDPARNYPRAMKYALPLVTLAYLLPVAAGLGATTNWTAWTVGYFPVVATAIGGKWLGTWLAIGGLVSAAALFNAIMLSISRLPAAMAEDGYLPQALTRKHGRFGTPWASIVVCGCIYSIFTLNAFASLIVIDVILYSAALSLEFAALIALRIKEPRMKRPVKVPGGWAGVILATLLPAGVLALAVVSTIQDKGAEVVYFSAAALLTGPIAYPILKRFVKRDQQDVAVPIEWEST
jgi:amino acid transporter